MVLSLPIDIKSLYFNIKNDNESGHTATVATPLLQYGCYHEELKAILDIPENINENSKESIIGMILSKSRMSAKIVRFIAFNRISVNGIEIQTDGFCYGIYIREETDSNKIHFGRQKVHYPTTLKYSDEEIEINNREIVKRISNELHDYAFVVESFNYDTETGVLDFNAVIVGYNGIPYSKVFINKKGVGNKFSTIFNEDASNYDYEIIALRDHLGYTNVSPDNFSSIIKKNDMLAESLVEEYLKNVGGISIRNLAADYPYSVYDISYTLNGLKRYAVVRQTATKLQYFNLSIEKVQFCNLFEGMVDVILVTDINGTPQIKVFNINELNKMNKRINSLMYNNIGEGL